MLYSFTTDAILSHYSAHCIGTSRISTNSILSKRDVRFVVNGSTTDCYDSFLNLRTKITILGECKAKISSALNIERGVARMYEYCICAMVKLALVDKVGFPCCDIDVLPSNIMKITRTVNVAGYVSTLLRSTTKD